MTECLYKSIETAKNGTLIPVFQNGKTMESRYNPERDAENLKYYQKQCWRVCFVWECAIRGKNSRQKIESVKDLIIQWLEESSDPFLEIKG